MIVPKADGDFDGLLVSYAKTYARLSNYTLRWTMPEDLTWGIPLESGEWNGIVGAVLRGDADIGVHMAYGF